jgi:hypothetical protein
VTFASAPFTHRNVDKLAKDRLLNTPNLSSSLTGGASSLGRTRLRTTTLTAGAGFPTRQFYVFLATEDSLFERDGQFIAKICASLRA